MTHIIVILQKMMVKSVGRQATLFLSFFSFFFIFLFFCFVFVFFVLFQNTVNQITNRLYIAPDKTRYQENIFLISPCLFVLRFYGPVNPMGSCRARSVYLTTRLLGRLSPLSG